MELVTPELAQALKANWRDQSGRRPPILKLFCPAGAATWLTHSADPTEPDRLFGLCDLGLGFPELGYVSLTELQKLQIPVRIQMGSEILESTISIERDLHFKSTHSLATYAHAAYDHDAITERTDHLAQAAVSLGIAA